MQLLLPIIYGVLEIVVLSQTYVRNLVGVAIRFICEPSPGGSDLVDNSRRAYTTAALIEMLRYLILVVPDTFVGLDCFPLPSCVISHVPTDGSLSKSSDDVKKIKHGSLEVSAVFRSKGLDAQYQSLAFDEVVSSIQKRADNLARIASPGYLGHSVAKAVQALDRSLAQGDVRGAYKLLFEDLREGTVNERWITQVSPCLRSSLKWIGTMSLSLICSVFFLCEWATCDFRDFRTAPPHELRFTGRKDFSQVHVAIRILKLKLRDLQSSPQRKSESPLGINNVAKGYGQQNNLCGMNSMGNLYSSKNNIKNLDQRVLKSTNIFESPGPLHDILVCWIDQHDASKGEGFKRLQLLIVELIHAGIFYPLAYVRQLIVSGIMEINGSVVEADRQRRHYRILKQLPGLFMRDALEEAGIVEGPELMEAIQVYTNERRLMLRGLLCNLNKNMNNANVTARKRKLYPPSRKDGASPSTFDQWKSFTPDVLSGKNFKSDADVEELKEAITVLLRLPISSPTSIDTSLDESQGSVKKLQVSFFNKVEMGEGTPGCDECRRAKRQKLGEDRNLSLLGHSLTLSDDEDSWWVRKGPKSSESLKVDPPLKSTKQAPRNRPKMVRKTQSLAQLAASRIEGSQGASTSHICDNKVNCPHHRTGVEGETPKSMEGIKMSQNADILSIGKALKKLRFVEKRTVTVWLMTVIRQLVEETGKIVPKGGQFGRTFTPVDEKSNARWKLGEEELSAILYLMDVSNDLVSAVKFLLWLAPKVLSSPNSTIHSGRNILPLPRNVENNVCEVGEAFLVSSLRRYILNSCMLRDTDLKMKRF